MNDHRSSFKLAACDTAEIVLDPIGHTLWHNTVCLEGMSPCHSLDVHWVSVCIALDDKSDD